MTTLNAMLGSGRGILVADDGVLAGCLESAGMPPAGETRRACREMLVTTPGLALGISGVVLGAEALRQRLNDGRTLPTALGDRGLLTGVRADAGARPLPGTPGETVTEGLDGLHARLTAWAGLGARFATWRSVVSLGAGRPSWQALHANAHAFIRFARLCQDADIVPVVQPELLAEGPRSREAISAALLVTLAELGDYGVRLDGVVLAPSMVLPGPAAPCSGPEAVADQTVAALRCAVPGPLAGVALLSGAQSPARATANLAAITRLGAPWPLTFCFGRALAGPAVTAWRGDTSRLTGGHRALANRVACNVAALQGSYAPALGPSYVLA